MIWNINLDNSANLDEHGIIRTDNYIFPCPVCDTPNQFFDIGSYGICKVCGWEDDDYQYEYQDETGANKMTFNEAKTAWLDGESIYPEYPNPNQKAS